MTSNVSCFLVMLVLLVKSAWAITPPPPSTFGKPVVVGDKIVFNGPGHDPHRIICVSQSNGEKLWEIVNATNYLETQFSIGGQVIVTVDSDLHWCDPVSGRLTLLHRTGYGGCHLRKIEGNQILIEGDRWSEGQLMSYLSCVDSLKWKKTWEVNGIEFMNAVGKKLLLCKAAARDIDANNPYSDVGRAMVAISLETGATAWRYPLPELVEVDPEGVAVGDYFLFKVSGAIHCVNQRSGKNAGHWAIPKDVPNIITFLALKDRLLINTFDPDIFSPFISFTLTVPSLKRKAIGKNDWKQASSYIHGGVAVGESFRRVEAHLISSGKKLWEQQVLAWDRASDGRIYFTLDNVDGKHATIHALEIKTGKRSKLYEEELPKNIQWEK